MSRRTTFAFLSDWGTTIAAFTAVFVVVLLCVLAVITFFLTQQLHTVLIQEHRTTLAVIQDEILRQTKGAVVVRASCIIVELVNKTLPAGVHHIPTNGCPPLPPHFK